MYIFTLECAKSRVNCAKSEALEEFSSFERDINFYSRSSERILLKTKKPLTHKADKSQRLKFIWRYKFSSKTQT